MDGGRSASGKSYGVSRHGNPSLRGQKKLSRSSTATSEMLAVGDPVSICEKRSQGAARSVIHPAAPTAGFRFRAQVNQQHQQQEGNNLSELTMGTLWNES